ncbi:hypothetical protein Droror1_Dr00020259 [Drosera rotundifolia]
MGRSLARGGRGKERSSVGIHIQEHTTPPPSIGVAAPAPVCIAATAAMLVVPTTPAVHVEHTTPPPSIGVAAQPLCVHLPHWLQLKHLIVESRVLGNSKDNTAIDYSKDGRDYKTLESWAGEITVQPSKCRQNDEVSIGRVIQAEMGSVNHFTHAMMLKGGKEWALEFPDRSQWALFKEMHEECYKSNIRAALVKTKMRN